ncbi:uncharacterized protein JCM6883_003931 [Sporobolomyces salmoneus]|uniref:uncharacterized protein n=1 Tax=Sporobolomyces salmoneus TaxID=183962 RepID=UPI003170A831
MTSTKARQAVKEAPNSTIDYDAVLSAAAERIKFRDSLHASIATYSSTEPRAKKNDWTARGLPWMVNLPREAPEATQAAQKAAIDEELEAFVEWIRPREWETKVRHSVVKCFEQVVNKMMLSVASRLGCTCPTRVDFDIVIQDESFKGQQPTSYFNQLRSALETSGFSPKTSIRLILNARVPLIKFTTSSNFGSFKFDVSFSSGGKMNGPEGAKISLKLLKELEDRGENRRNRGKALIWIIKLLIEARGLNEVKNGGLGGFSVLCLCVWFMQVRGSSSSSLFDRQSAVLDLATLFLYFGRELDTGNHALCTSNGGKLLSKKDMNWSSDANKLSIQHPVQLERDLSSGSHRWSEIRQLFRTNYNHISHTIGRPQDPRALKKRSSILSKLGLRIDQRVISNRARRQQLHDSGAFESTVSRWNPHVIAGAQAVVPRQAPFHRSPQLPQPSSVSSFRPADYGNSMRLGAIYTWPSHLPQTPVSFLDGHTPPQPQQGPSEQSWGQADQRFQRFYQRQSPPANRSRY